MNNTFGFWVLFMAMGTALVFLSFTRNGTFGGLAPPDCVESTTTKTNRKLKENSYHLISKAKKIMDLGNINLDDYQTIDPVPTSKVMESGPIIHGTPLNPYIPKPIPSVPPKQSGSP